MMRVISLEDDAVRSFYGVPSKIAKDILNKNNILFFDGFNRYTERNSEGELVAIFHFNELGFCKL